MSSSSRKLQQQAQQESAQEQQLAAEQRAIREFSGAEEVLRCDAEKVVVPAHIAARLQESLAREQPSMKPWWQRWFDRQ